MKWLRFRHHGTAAFGTLDGYRVHIHQGDMFGTPVATGESLPLADLTCLAPCAPGKVIGLWNNFRAAAEKNGWAEPAEPLYFLKSPGSVIGHQQPIPVPASHDGRVAFEGELAVVIGRQARAVSVADASVAVALCLVPYDGDFLSLLEALVGCLNLCSLDVRSADCRVLSVVYHEHLVEFYLVALFEVAEKLNFEYVSYRDHVLLTASLNDCEFSVFCCRFLCLCHSGVILQENPKICNIF